MELSYQSLEQSLKEERITQEEYAGQIRDLDYSKSRLSRNQNDVPQGMPTDLRFSTAVLICLNAALVIAANLLIMISERTKEIGILKAVGSRGREITGMAMAEAFLLTVMGSMLGFSVIRLPALLNQLVRQTALSVVLSRLMWDALYVFSATLAAAFFCALMPALRMAALPTMQTVNSE